jgi:ferredoxin-like protein FixX
MRFFEEIIVGQIAIKHEVILEQMECGTCGVVFAIPQEMYHTARRSGGWWHCPNGHCRGWQNGTDHTRIKELERDLEAERVRKNEALRRANESAEAELKAQNEIKRMKKRASAGVCPCCNRTFQQLARHMKTKHPGHAA